MKKISILIALKMCNLGNKNVHYWVIKVRMQNEHKKLKNALPMFAWQGVFHSNYKLVIKFFNSDLPVYLFQGTFLSHTCLISWGLALPCDSSLMG